MKKALILLLFFNPHFMIGASIPRPVLEDSRIKVVKYDPNQVVEVRTSYGNMVTIELGQEIIQSTAAGNSAVWSIVPQGNRLYIKPKIAGASFSSTNLNVITDKRNYYFNLKNNKRNNPTFVIRFVYEKSNHKKSITTDTNNYYKNYNNNYLISKKSNIKVSNIYDDGQFTYILFPKNQSLPEIYVVNDDKREELTNTRKEGNYIVVEKVAKQFSLVLGDQRTCIVNDRLKNPLDILPQLKQGDSLLQLT